MSNDQRELRLILWKNSEDVGDDVIRIQTQPPCHSLTSIEDLSRCTELLERGWRQRIDDGVQHPEQPRKVADERASDGLFQRESQLCRVLQRNAMGFAACAFVEELLHEMIGELAGSLHAGEKSPLGLRRRMAQLLVRDVVLQLVVATWISQIVPRTEVSS
jgi:hypothetical protein